MMYELHSYPNQNHKSTPHGAGKNHNSVRTKATNDTSVQLSPALGWFSFCTRKAADENYHTDPVITINMFRLRSAHLSLLIFGLSVNLSDLNPSTECLENLCPLQK